MKQNNITNNEIVLYGKTYEDSSNRTYLSIRDRDYTRSVDIIINSKGVVEAIDIHGHDDKKIDVSKSKIRTNESRGHKWRTLKSGSLDITLHHSKRR
jgi:short-subunit dehydrogenase involved in D-alanine esterification of teichoic acids